MCECVNVLVYKSTGSKEGIKKAYRREKECGNASDEGCKPKAMSTLKIDIMQRITPLKLINEVSQCVNV